METTQLIADNSKCHLIWIGHPGMRLEDNMWDHYGDNTAYRRQKQMSLTMDWPGRDASRRQYMGSLWTQHSLSQTIANVTNYGLAIPRCVQKTIYGIIIETSQLIANNSKCHLLWIGQAEMRLEDNIWDHYGHNTAYRRQQQMSLTMDWPSRDASRRQYMGSLWRQHSLSQIIANGIYYGLAIPRCVQKTIYGIIMETTQLIADNSKCHLLWIGHPEMCLEDNIWYQYGDNTAYRRQYQMTLNMDWPSRDASRRQYMGSLWRQHSLSQTIANDT